MAKVVRLLDADNRTAGVVRWDGERLSVAPDVPWLRAVLDEAIVLPAKGGMRVVTAEEPEAFLDGLRFHYKSPYLRATAPEEEPA